MKGGIKASVPRRFLFDAVAVMRRTESMLASLDNCVRGIEVAQGALKDTALGRTRDELADLRAECEKFSMEDS